MIRVTIVLGLAAALLTSCGSATPEKDDAGRVVPPAEFLAALDLEDVVPLVQDGTAPDGEELPGLPDDLLERLTFVTTGVAWPEDTEVVGEALRDEARAEDEFLGELVVALGEAERTAPQVVASPLLELFGEKSDEVLEALAGAEGGIASQESVIRALRATGSDGGTVGLTEVRRGLTAAAEAGLTGELSESASGSAEARITAATSRWVVPRAVAEASLFAEECAPEASACSVLSTRIEESLARNFSFDIYQAVPLADLPADLRKGEEHLEAFAAPQYERWHAVAAPLGYDPRKISNEAVRTVIDSVE